MSKIVNKKILITGGAGFIGSNLCEYFLKHNEVVCLDNFSTGYHHNIQSFLSNPNFTLIEGDIRNFQICENAILGVDYVLHQAALGSVPRSINDPITSDEVSVAGFLNKDFVEIYPRELKQEYHFLKQKYSLKEVREHHWQLMRIRPISFPTIRLAWFAQVLQQMPLMQNIISSNTTNI